MFSYMADVLVWGVIVAMVGIAIALAAEGRGQHALRLLLGITPRRKNDSLIDAVIYESVPRPGNDWKILEGLGELGSGEIPLPVAKTSARGELVLSAREVKAGMPPTVEPRSLVAASREPISR